MSFSGFAIVVSSPSGAGKTTLITKLLHRDKTLKRVVTATTRKPRKNETDKLDYHFYTVERFQKGIKKKEFIEWAKVHNNFYGAPKKSVDIIFKKKQNPVMVIDVQGAEKIKKLYPDSVLIFIMPPSLKELKKRLIGRKDNSKDLKKRLETAVKELKKLFKYDYVVINDKVSDAVEDLENIISAEKLKTKRFKSVKFK